MPIYSSLVRRGNGLCLLSFDAGGSRGISQLKILAEMMHRLNFGNNDDNLYRPCSVFDMIGGVGSGGFIAILLVTFGLTAEEALEEFICLSVNILDKPEMDAQARTANLKDHVNDMLNKYEIDPSMRVLDPNDHSRGCKLAIPISYKHHIGSTLILRNYSVRQEQPLNLTIVEALLATLATPSLFESISVIKDSGTFEYIGAEMMISNPTQDIIAEAHGAFGADERVACILSLGCGHPGVLNLPETPELVDRVRLLENLLTAAQQKAQNLESRMGDLGVYYRFSVSHGLQRESSTTLLDPGNIMTYTKVYLNDQPVSRKLDTCIDSLRVRDGVSSLEQLKSSGGKTVFSLRLPPVTKTFVMRKEPWNFIKKVILEPRESQDTDEPRMLVVTGIGGCGKTQLMLSFMKAHREQFASLFFLDGSSRDRIRADMIRNVRALGNEHSQKGFDDCLVFLSQPSGDSMRLLLYDNVDDPDLDLSSLLPQGNSCVIAVTSRNRILGDLYPDSHLSLDVMSMDEATTLLLHSSISITDQARKDATELAQALGCLPIALQQARSYMQQAKCSIRDYLARLSSSRARLLGKAIKYQIDMQAISTYAAFETSFDRLATHAKKLLWLLAYFHWSGFPLELVVLAAKRHFEYQRTWMKPGNDFYLRKKMLEDIFFLDETWDIIHMDEMIVSLQSYSLVTVVPGVDTSLLQMHPLMHEWLLSSIPKGEGSLYQTTAVLLLALGACDDITAATQYLGSHVVHLRSLLDQLCINDAAAFCLILDQNGLFEDALPVREAVVRELKRELAPDNIELYDATRGLAHAYWASGRLNEAAAFQEDVLKSRKEILGQRHPHAIRASSNLAIIYFSLGRIKEAQVLEEEVLQLRKEILGEQHPDTIGSSHNLASIYEHLGLFKEAQVLQEEALKLKKETLGERHPDTIMVSTTLALTYSNLGRLKEAQVLREEALNLWKDLLGERNPNTIGASSSLAIIYTALGRLQEARILQEKSLREWRELFGERHIETVYSLNSLATIYRDLGLLSEAEDLQNTALTVTIELLGASHPDAVIASHELAITYRDQGRFEEALVAMERVLDSRKELHGEHHPRTILASSDLATVLHRLGRLDEAETLTTEAVRLWTEKFGVRHPDTLIASRNLASLYCDLGRLEEAEALQLETLAAMQEVLGDRHHKTTNTMLVLARIHISCRRKAEALQILTTAEATISDVLGIAHAQYLECQKLKEEAQNLTNLVQVRQGETQPGVESSINAS